MTDEVEKKKNGWGGAREGAGGYREGVAEKMKGNKNALGHGHGRPTVDPTGAPTVVLNLKVPMSQKIYVQENGGASFVRALIEAHQQGKLVL